ncbi:MAG: hypothetical protein R2752_20385 [Vicinamibacterales bacterium]
MPGPNGTRSTLDRLRRYLLALLVFGFAATSLDLTLLEHYEDARQIIPFGVIALSLATIVWHAATRSPASLVTLRLLMVVCLFTGGLGLVFHFQGNMGFQLDMNPDIGKWDLFWRVMHAKAPPALAPGAMAQLGLLGLIYAYRHPAGEPAGPDR